ncbi:MAG: hemerythrin domain-containing protein [Actinomycetota bacterium]|nr:hemerythrin domain-containing protein [Actinomycetota bacterium]
MPKRHASLIPLTHDHHHALAQARRLRIAADGDGAELLARSTEFFRFFHDETIEHFREEEETVFPLGVGDERAEPLLARVLLEHLRLHARVSLLGDQIDEGKISREAATQLADALESHIRLEEGEVFPLLEEIVPKERLDAIALPPRNRAERPPS